MLVTTKEMFEKAQKENYAIPAANFFDLDSARTFVEVAEKMQKPLILAFAQAHIEECPLEEAALIATYLAKKQVFQLYFIWIMDKMRKSSSKQSSLGSLL